jgi:hypothetical protein
MLKMPASTALKEYPDYHDAELVMKLYELRREPVMRESRRLLFRGLLPRSADDLLAVTRGDHPLNEAYRQTSTYWEMAYGMVKHGVLHAEFMLESNGEGLALLARVYPFLAEVRATAGPRSFVNAEWVATNTELGRGMFAAMRTRVEKLREAPPTQP